MHYYQAADVSIVPSVALEGFGLVVLESLATGTPVVASALDGLSEALEGLTPELLVPPGDPEPLAERLRGALTGVEPLPTAKACRRYAEGFSWTAVGRRHGELYGHLVGRAAKGQIVEQHKLRVVVLGHTAQLSGGELAIYRVASALPGIQVHAILAQDGPLVGLLERAGVSVEILPMKERGTRSAQGPGAMGDAACRGVCSRRCLRLSAWETPATAGPRPGSHEHAEGGPLWGHGGAPCPVAVRLAHPRPDSAGLSSLFRRATRSPRRQAAAGRGDRKLPRHFDTLPTGTSAPTQIVYDAVPEVTTSRAHVTAVIPSPVVRPRLEQVPWSSPSPNFRVAMVGRLAPWKGQDVFLRAFAKAFSDGEVIAVLVGAALFGEDDYERQLRQLVDDLGIEERVEFRGFRSEVFEELARVDVLVHASVIPEPFGQVVLEGMAAGLPVVAAGAGGPAEILVDGETGLLYPPGDIDALASLLRLLADDAELRSRLGDQARTAAAKYSPERSADQILEVYERVLRGKIRAPGCDPSKRRSFFRRRESQSR